jgi:HAD superfamily hydrolase (TIGR01457 family)
MLADRYDVFLFDLDGVLYRGDEPIPGAARAVGDLRAKGRTVAFITNNSSATPQQVAKHLRRVGVHAAAAEVETSALTTASILAARGMSSAFVIGEDGVRSALVAAGLVVIDDEPDAVDVVVVGLDRQVDYAKLRSASRLVQRGAALVATNPDTTYPAPDGSRWPGAGSLLAAVVAATEVSPEVFGKPEPPIFRAALERVGGGSALVVGDRLDTDIVGAARLGWDSLLVLTGIATPSQLESSPVKPTYVGADLGALFDSRE